MCRDQNWRLLTYSCVLVDQRIQRRRLLWIVAMLLPHLLTGMSYNHLNLQ